MSEKIRTEVQESDNQDQLEKPTEIEIQTPQTPPEGELESEAMADDMAAKLHEAEQKSLENYDRLLRVSAEFDNYKKRTTREMQETVKYANERMARELLTVVDNLERAIEAASADGPEDDPLVKGVHLTLTEVLKILERHQVKPVKALGEPFDPTYHQAMMQEEVDDQPPNTVVREMQKGYVMHDRLLRPAMVVVSKAKENKAESRTE